MSKKIIRLIMAIAVIILCVFLVVFQGLNPKLWSDIL